MKKSLLANSAILFGFLISCTPPVYLPNTVNAPLLEEKEEINCGLNKTLDGYDLQLSGAISDNVGLMFNGTYLSYRRKDRYRKHTFGEFGIGFFSPQYKNLIFEIYFGAGLGSNSLKENIFLYSEDAEVSANYFRLFAQPVFGARLEGVECGFAMRMGYVNFHKINYSNIEFMQAKLLFEPVVFFRIGPPFLQIQFQCGYSLDPFKDLLQIPFSDEWIAGVGFNIRPNIKTKHNSIR